MINIPISVLELATVNIDSDFKTAIDDRMKIAQLADELNYKRIWLQNITICRILPVLQLHF